MSQQGYGYTPLHPHYPPQASASSYPSHAAAPASAGFYPSYPEVVPGPSSAPSYDARSHSVHPAPAATPRPVPSRTAGSQQLVAGIPKNIFFNVGALSPQLSDVFPVPSGTKHASLLADPAVKDHAEKVLANPSASCIKAVASCLAAVQPQQLHLKGRERTEAGAESSANSYALTPAPSALELYLNQTISTISLRRSSRVKSHNVPRGPPAAAPALSTAPSKEKRSSHPSVPTSEFQPTPPASAVPTSASVGTPHVVPSVQLMEPSPAARPPAQPSPELPFTQSKVSVKMLSPPCGDRPLSSRSTSEETKKESGIKMVFKIRDGKKSSGSASGQNDRGGSATASSAGHTPWSSVKAQTPVRDENQGPGSPEIPEIPMSRSPEIPVQPPAFNRQFSEQIIEKKPVDTVSFDPSKLTLKISQVSTATAAKVFSLAMSMGAVKKRKIAPSSLVPSSSKSNLPPQIARTKESRKMLPYSPEAPEEHPALKSFLATLDRVMKYMSQVDLSGLATTDPDAELTDADIPSDAVLPHSLASSLASDTAKLKAHDQTRLVQPEHLQNLLVAILPTILYATVIPTDLLNYSQESEELDQNVYREILNHRIIRGSEAIVSAMSIMTSPGLSKKVLNSEVIDACIRFAKHHAVHTIYPAFDPLYKFEAQSKDGFVSKIKQKRARSGHAKEESVLSLYSRFEDIVLLFADAVSLRIVDQTPMFQLASLGVSAFFVENIRDLQLKSLRLVANIFSRFEAQRDAICDDILSSLGRLPSTKRNLRNYVVGNAESIQMISALILHLIQSIARLPSKRQLMQGHGKMDQDYEQTVILSYDESIRCAKQILSAFFMKCVTKGDEDYRPLFENFIVDLLTTVNKPEWPAAECLLDVLGKILVQKITDKSLDANFRYASIDYLGLITAQMRKDALSLKENPEQLQDVVTKLYQAFALSDEGIVSPGDEMPSETHLFQQGLLYYLWHSVPAPSFAGTYHLVQWYNDYMDLKRGGGAPNEDDEQIVSPEELAKTQAALLEFMRVAIDPGRKPSGSSKQVVDVTSANLISRHFAIKRPFARNFDSYFRKLLAVANDNAMQIRIRAFKAVSGVIDADGTLMAEKSVKELVESRTWDNSAMIRDTVVEMIGNYAKENPEQIQHYLQVLVSRLMDTAPSVRKKAIRVLHDFLMEYPDHELYSKICGNIIKRINDNEETIKKLVYEVFESTWFGSSKKADMAGRVDQIVSVVQMLDGETPPGTEWIEKLLKDLLKRDAAQNSSAIRKSCKAVVDFLMQKLLAMDVDKEKTKDENKNVAACFTMLSLFAKCSPDLVADHVQSMPQFLNQTLRSQSDQKIVCITASILALVVPLMKNPPDLFLAQIEESCSAVYGKPGVSIQLLQVTTECLAAVINGATRNYGIVRGLYERFWNVLSVMSTSDKKESVFHLQRAMCIVALIIQHFDTDQESFGYVQTGTDRLIESFLSLLRHKFPVVQDRALQSLGFIFIRKPETMLQKRYSDIYGALLGSSNKKIDAKKTVLVNLTKYLEHEEAQVLAIEESGTAQQHYDSLDLKGNQTAAAELPRKIVYNYLKAILECGLDPNLEIRKEVLSLIAIVVRLRMCGPLQVIPYLIAIGTDPNEDVSEKAVRIMDELSRKYHHENVLYTKALPGIKESFTFQKSLNSGQLIRGYKTTQNGLASIVGEVYGALRSDKKHRRLLVNAMLEDFKLKDTPLDQLLYFADNLAYFAYQNLDEPYYVIYQIEPILAMISPDALHRFRKAFRLTAPVPEDDSQTAEPLDEDDLETTDNLRRCLPGDLTEIRECYRNCQGSILLIALKRFLANLYSITPAKAKEYSTSEAKVYEKPITTRKANCKYEPAAVCEYISREAKNELADYLTPQLLIKKFLEFRAVVNLIDDRDTGAEREPVADASTDNVDADGDEEMLDSVDETEPSSSDRASSVPHSEPSTSSVISSPRKRKADDVFKKPRTPKKKPDPNAPKRPRGRPRKNPLPQSPVKHTGSDSEDEDESYRP